jgi:hypothetical protein
MPSKCAMDEQIIISATAPTNAPTALPPAEQFGGKRTPMSYLGIAALYEQFSNVRTSELKKARGTIKRRCRRWMRQPPIFKI